MNGYPYPVLTEADSSYKEDVKFNIEFLKYICKEDSIALSVGITLESSTLKQHIVDNNAEIVIKAVTGIRSLLFHIDGIQNNIEIKINNEDIKPNDSIKITSFIVAKTPFKLEISDEMEDLFGANYSIVLKKGDVLAISNDEKLNYNTTNNDFIMISGSEEMTGKGIRIRLNDENHIYILVGPEFKRAYATLNNPKLSTALGSHLIFEAFVYTLVEIAQEKEDHSNKEWYRLFVQALEIIGDSLDDFKLKAMDGSKVDMSYVFEVAQAMISNSLETSTININKIGG